jgi:hypothetical protein
MIVSRAGQRGNSCPGCEIWSIPILDETSGPLFGINDVPRVPMCFRVGAGGWGDGRYRSSRMILGFLPLVEGEAHTN